MKPTMQAIFVVRVARRDRSVVRKNLVNAVVPVEAGDDESISLPSWKSPEANDPYRMIAETRRLPIPIEPALPVRGEVPHFPENDPTIHDPAPAQRCKSSHFQSGIYRTLPATLCVSFVRRIHSCTCVPYWSANSSSALSSLSGRASV